MRRIALLLCAAAILAMATTGAHAAQIVFKNADSSTSPDDWNTMYGSSDAILWDWTDDVPDYTQNPAGSTNPSYISEFTFGLTGGGGGSGGGGGGGGSAPIGNVTGDLRYDLQLSENKSFDFTALFYDSNYGTRNSLANDVVALAVRLLDPGSDESQDDWHEITVGELVSGTFLTWEVTAEAGEYITTDVEWVAGDGAGVSGFFLDNVQDVAEIPEPATIGLLAFGVAGLFIRRKK